MMTVYSTTIKTSPGDMLGSHTTTFANDRANEGTFVSTDDMPFEGPTVIDGKTGAVKGITSTADLAPNDRIEIDGIPMTVQQARNLGLNISVEPQANTGSKTKLVVPQARTPKAEPQEMEDPSPFTTDSELVAGDTMAQAFELHTGLSRAEVQEMGADIALGSIADDDELWSALGQRGVSREAAKATVARAQDMVAQAARREMGPEKFARLEQLAEQSAAVRNLVVKHGINRLNGTAKVGWNDVLQLCEEWSAR